MVQFICLLGGGGEIFKKFDLPFWGENIIYLKLLINFFNMLTFFRKTENVLNRFFLIYIF